MASGNVVLINNKRGMVVVQCDNGSYSVLEILGYSDLEQGSNIRGDINSEGSCTIFNLDTNSDIDVIVQNAGCNYNHALKRAQLT
jgi:hypothetical protein